jgi:hypothetical protein
MEVLIQKRRIKNLNLYLAHVPAGSSVVIGVKDPGRFTGVLKKLGFTSEMEPGETVLPAPVGPISNFNAVGKSRVHRDQPMETAYRMADWHWQEWHGRYDRVERSKIVDIPYKRFPRTFIEPPSIELQISATTQGERVVTSPPIDYVAEQESLLVHVINLFLEVFRECSVFTQELGEIIIAPVKNLNWRVLPPGRWPWEKLREEIGPLVQRARVGNRAMIEYRLETINRYEPDFVAVGQAGFQGYVGFGFTEKDLYVFESIYTGNATYVFDERWERLSRMTKAEILDQGLQTARIIHRSKWASRIHSLLVERLEKE